MAFARKTFGLLVAVQLLGVLAGSAIAGVHKAPIVVPGYKIRHATRYPIASYRLFRTDKDGTAVPIPFQIDEINQFGDYVLDQGSDITKKDGNQIFDLQDEMVFMGDDVGPVKAPTKWTFIRPTLLFEIRHVFKGNPKVFDGNKEGAVYLGIYWGKTAPLSKKNYVVFDKKKGEVRTSRYAYRFDQKNYLVVNGIDMKDRKNPEILLPMIDSSTFYMKADLKYFLTLEVNHRDVQSTLEAYKVGPIRTIVRVSFFYRFLKINFELGMYTEVSLFSNAIELPAIMYNPLDGDKSLNAGSGFYYGFGITDNPKNYKIESNIPEYVAPTTSSKILDFFTPETKIESLYWLSITNKDRMMYFEIKPSKEMLARKNIPTLYTENKSAADMKKAKRTNDKAAPLGISPVNLGLHFDLTKFSKGEHRISFKTYFDNYFDQAEMNKFKELKHWDVELRRI